MEKAEKAYRLGMVEDAIAEMDFSEVADDVLESDEDYQIVISGWRVNVPELGLDLYDGVYCCYDKDEGDYLPDFAVTVIKEEGQEEWIYYEQDGFLVTLANFLHGKTDLDKLGQMRCFIRLPDGNLPV